MSKGRQLVYRGCDALAAAKDMTLSSRSRSADQRSSSRSNTGTILFPFHSEAHRLHILNTQSSGHKIADMAYSLFVSVLVVVASVCVMEIKASHYSSAPQYTWAPREAVPPTHAPSRQYNKGQVTAPGYNSAPGFWYGSSSKGDNWSFNRLPASGYASGFYKNERADRLSVPSAFGPLSTTEGRVSGKAMAAGGYSRFTTNYQDPLHTRYGSFTIPPRSPQEYERYGNYRNMGYYGAKGPAVSHYPLTGSPPVNIQPLRGSRIYDGHVGLKHDQTKKTGVYVIPTPAKLYYDGVKN